jgi:hypothetical protein
MMKVCFRGEDARVGLLRLMVCMMLGVWLFLGICVFFLFFVLC